MTTTQSHAAKGSAGIAECQGKARRSHRHLAELARRARLARLATVGEMAAGLAHELSQPLSVATYHAGVLARGLDIGGIPHMELLERIEKIVGTLERASNITRSIRAFVSPHEPRRTTFDVNDAIRAAIHLAQAEARQYDVTIELELADHLPPVQADRTLLEQVILNLVRNGIQAMSAAAGDTKTYPCKLTIEASPGRRDEGEIVEVAVRDMGEGLPDRDIDRLFDAFYTTKPGGMGLGLSLSRSIVEGAGGRLWATANADRGATFRFTLPAACQA